MLRRPVAMVLLVTLVPQLAGCVVRTAQRIPPAQLRPDEQGLPGTGEPRVVGVTTYQGRDVMFDSLPDVVSGRDALYGNVRGTRDSVAIPTIARMWVARPGNRAVPVEASDLGSALTTAAARKAPIVGVTLGSGEEVRFDRRAPTHLAHDTLYATVAGEPYGVPLAHVERVWVLRTNAGLTVLKSAGVLAGLSAILGGAFLIALADSWN